MAKRKSGGNPLKVLAAPILGRLPEEWGAQCGVCPLNEQAIVPCEPALHTTPDGWARVAIVGEGPGKVEAVLGRPLVGESGAFMNTMFKRNDINLTRESAHLTNAMLCQPKKHTSGAEFTAAVHACSPRLARELRTVAPGGLIITVGGKAMQSLTGKTNIKDWRGYPLKAVGEFEFLNERGITIFPTWHPAYILRAPAYLPFFISDMRRALGFLNGTSHLWQWPQIEIDEGPEMEALLTRMLKENAWVGVDVETAGEDPYTCDLLCIGLGASFGAVSVPWPATSPVINDLVRAILRNPGNRKAYQNGNYDLISLAAWNIENTGSDFDTLIAHRLLAPQVMHSLQFVAQSYFMIEPWKAMHAVGDDRKGDERWKIARGDRERYHALRDYNAKDAYATVITALAMFPQLGLEDWA